MRDIYILLRNQLICYIDKSKVKKKKKAKVCIIHEKHIKFRKYKLNKETSILNVELYTIYKALKWISQAQNSKHKNIYIYTDSQQVI